MNESQGQLQATADNLLDGVITIDEDGAIESFNMAAESIALNVKLLMPDPYKHEHDGYLKNYPVTGCRKLLDMGVKCKACVKAGNCFPLDWQSVACNCMIAGSLLV